MVTDVKFHHLNHLNATISKGIYYYKMQINTTTPLVPKKKSYFECVIIEMDYQIIV